jgi:hypothetical protein
MRRATKTSLRMAVCWPKTEPWPSIVRSEGAYHSPEVGNKDIFLFLSRLFNDAVSVETIKRRQKRMLSWVDSITADVSLFLRLFI